MSMLMRQGLARTGMQGYRERITQRFPKLAERMKPFWDAMDKKYGIQSADGGAPAGASAPAASAPLGAAPPLPQAGGRTTKTLLGM